MLAEKISHIILEIKNFDPLFDSLTIATLAILEGILSIDNALVLAILVKDLPPKMRKRALTWGIWGAFIFRFIAIILATWIMKMTVFKLIGGGYLIYLSMKHMFLIGGSHSNSQKKSREKKTPTFLGAILAVEMTDMVFSVDSITTAVAMTDKIIIIWIGGILGIIFMRGLSGLFIKLLEQFPRTEDLAYQLVFFVGTKLAFESFNIKFPHSIFWIMMGVITIIGSSLIYRDYYLNKQKDIAEEKIIDDYKSGDMTFEEILDKQETISCAVIKNLIRTKLLVVTSKQELHLLKKIMDDNPESQGA